MTDLSFTEVFGNALHGSPTVVVGLGAEPVALPVDMWTRPADAVDRAMVALCVDSTLDIGCGPGRMTHALQEAGHVALGIDVVDAAVTLTRQRGASALCRDVFRRVPGEGRWETVLLADGNIGIGGDPVTLLQRVLTLLAPGGRVVVEVTGPGTGLVQSWAVLDAEGQRSRPFRWATLGLDDLEAVAEQAGLAILDVHHLEDRWVAVLWDAD